MSKKELCLEEQNFWKQKNKKYSEVRFIHLSIFSILSVCLLIHSWLGGELWRCSKIHQEHFFSSTQTQFLLPLNFSLSLFFFNSHTKQRNHEIRQREGEREREQSLHQFSYANQTNFSGKTSSREPLSN